MKNKVVFLCWFVFGVLVLLGDKVSKAEYFLTWLILIAFLLRDIYREFHN